MLGIVIILLLDIISVIVCIASGVAEKRAEKDKEE